jgi:tetratricopeptide (TPR) repeat protein
MTCLDALQQSGDAEEYERALLLAIELCEARGERLREGIVRAHYAVFNWIWSRHDAAGVNADIALKIAKESGFFVLRDSAQSMTAHIQHAVGRLDDAIETYKDLIDTYRPEDERSTFGRMFFPSVRSCAFLASFLLDRGRIADAKHYIERGERILGDLDQPYSRVLITNAHGRLALATGDAEKAVALLQKTLDACIKGEIHLVEPSAAGELASALVRVGKPEQAREILRQIVEQKRYLRSGRYASVRVFRGLAEAELACGDGKAALATIDEGLLMAIENKEPIHIAQTRHLRGLALIATGDRAGGIEEIKTALGLARDLKLDPLAAECEEALANLTPSGRAPAASALRSHQGQ